ncbi:ClpP/crotonase-like domain-containing protein [Chytridium lagenaria]|nr:ClpP/crotonase-like domain-containing protein [Chytridium lagenaria]
MFGTLFGGDGMTCDFFLSHLVDEQMDLCSIYWRPQNQTMTTKTIPDEVKVPKYLNKPIYVLTNNKTFSACEKFAICIQAINRAKIVGATTAGGGHPCTFVRAGHDHFSASISIGKTTCLATGNGWEGIGCIPDIAVSGDIDPLDVAHLDAVRMVLSAVEEEAKEGPLSMGKKRLLDEIKKTVEELEGKVKDKENEVIVPAAGMINSMGLACIITWRVGSI